MRDKDEEVFSECFSSVNFSAESRSDSIDAGARDMKRKTKRKASFSEIQEFLCK